VSELTIPAPLAILDVASEGATFRVRRHGNPRGPRLLVSHGNGFAVDGYFRFWSRFLADFEVVVFDMRNHGWNELADPPGHDYAHMARDVEHLRRAVGEGFGQKPTAGVFHSMAAQSAMIAAIETGWRFDALILFDPPNRPPAGHPAYAPMVSYLRVLIAWAAGRRAHFADPDELARDYAATRAGRFWTAGGHRLVAEAVLRPAQEGGWELRCPPALEAAMYEQGVTLDLWPPRAAFAGPVKLIGADPDRSHPTPTALSNRALAAEGGYDYIAVPGTGHLLQLEQPAACADAVREFLAKVGFS